MSKKTIQKGKNSIIRESIIAVSLSVGLLVLFGLALLMFPMHPELEPIMFTNTALYLVVIVLIWRSARLSIANKAIVYIFLFSFLIITPYSIFLTFYTPELHDFYVVLYNSQHIVVSTVLLLTTTYIFFYSLTPKMAPLKMLGLSLFISLSVVIIINFNIDVGKDILSQAKDPAGIPRRITENSYYIYLINLSFLIFIWVTYHQGNYILSEYLPSVISIHTLMIMNEIYQLYNINNLIDNFVPAQYFNMLVNIGFIAVWWVRLRYISDPGSKKNEHYVLNYDLLKDFINKPKNNILEIVLKKWGKLRVYSISILVFLMISVPLLFLGDVNHFMRINMLLLVLFWLAGMVYAVYYTQKRWFKQVGFLIFKQKKKSSES